jgi:hypothetical protein
VTERNADPSLDYETERTIQLTTALRLRLEYLMVVQRLRSTAFMTANATLSTAQQFDNFTSGASTPVTTLQGYCDVIGYANQGRKPNRIAMTTFTLRAICQSEQFKDLSKYQVVQNAQLSQLNKSMSGQVALVEQLIGVEPGTILLSDAVYNVAAAGLAASYTTFMGPDILLGYVEEWGLRKFSLSARFQWSAYSNDPQAIIAVPRYDRTMVPVEDLRAFTVIDPLIVQPELGFLIKGAINTTAPLAGTGTPSYGVLVAN